MLLELTARSGRSNGRRRHWRWQVLTGFGLYDRLLSACRRQGLPPGTAPTASKAARARERGKEWYPSGAELRRLASAATESTAARGPCCRFIFAFRCWRWQCGPGHSWPALSVVTIVDAVCRQRLTAAPSLSACALISLPR